MNSFLRVSFGRKIPVLIGALLVLGGVLTKKEEGKKSGDKTGKRKRLGEDVQGGV